VHGDLTGNVLFAVVDALFRPGEPQRPDEDDCFLGPVELACSLAG
jgi:hypothetical protein